MLSKTNTRSKKGLRHQSSLLWLLMTTMTTQTGLVSEIGFTSSSTDEPFNVLLFLLEKM